MARETMQHSHHPSGSAASSPNHWISPAPPHYTVCADQPSFSALSSSLNLTLLHLQRECIDSHRSHTEQNRTSSSHRHQDNAHDGAMAMAPQQLEHEQPHHAHRPDDNTSSIATNRWGPYSGAGDFASNMAVILAALLAALALALALNAAVRYLLRRGRRAGEEGGGEDPEKQPVEEPEAPPPLPVLVYSASRTKLAGAAAECAICLAEFVDGHAVRVMPACGHGFHARCIERWLAGGRRSSCPTCRAPAAAPPAATTGGSAAQQADEAATGEAASSSS